MPAKLTPGKLVIVPRSPRLARAAVPVPTIDGGQSRSLPRGRARGADDRRRARPAPASWSSCRRARRSTTGKLTTGKLVIVDLAACRGLPRGRVTAWGLPPVHLVSHSLRSHAGKVTPGRVTRRASWSSLTWQRADDRRRASLPRIAAEIAWSVTARKPRYMGQTANSAAAVSPGSSHVRGNPCAWCR